jgi:amino acid transporter
MYLGLTFSIAEMSPALPHTGAAYSFARTAMGPWGGFITGLCENVEYVITPAVIVTFITAYATSIFGIDVAYSPAIWVLFYLIFLGLNVFGLELSFNRLWAMRRQVFGLGALELLLGDTAAHCAHGVVAGLLLMMLYGSVC